MLFMLYLEMRRICGIQYVGQTSRFLKLDLLSTIIVSKSLAKLILFDGHFKKSQLYVYSTCGNDFIRHPLGFNDNIIHEVYISRLPFFDKFSLLNIRKRNKRSHGIRKNVNLKRKNRHVLSFSDLSMTIKQSGRHMTLSRLLKLSISSLRNFDIEAKSSLTL